MIRDTVIFNKDNGEVLYSLLRVGEVATRFYHVKYNLPDDVKLPIEEMEKLSNIILKDYEERKTIFLNLVKENTEKWTKSIGDLKDKSDKDFWVKCMDEYVSMCRIYNTLKEYELDSFDVAEMIRSIEEEEVTKEWGDLTGFFSKLRHYSVEYAEELSDKETGLDIVKKFAPAYYSILKGRYDPSARKSTKDFMKHVLNVMKTLIDDKRTS